jgi:hypothetical protein
MALFGGRRRIDAAPMDGRQASHVSSCALTGKTKRRRSAFLVGESDGEERMTEQEQQQMAGSAIAAFMLAQFAFWRQIETGALPHAEAIAMLTQGVEANSQGGPANRFAAQKLQTVLDLVERSQKPASH